MEFAKYVYKVDGYRWKIGGTHTDRTILGGWALTRTRCTAIVTLYDGT